METGGMRSAVKPAPRGLGEQWWWLAMLCIGLFLADAIFPIRALLHPMEEAINSYQFDRLQHWVGAFAAMMEPIDWTKPLYISSLASPPGTTLALVDAVVLVSLPLRVLHEITGLMIDPAIALALFSFGAYALGPLSLYYLARTLGASRGGGLISGALVATLPPLALFFRVGWEGLSAWPLLSLLMAKLIIMEREGANGRRLLVATLLSAACLLSHAYLGAMAVALLAGLALQQALVRRAVSHAIALLGAALLPAVVILLLATNNGGLSISGSGLNGGENGALSGLLSFQFPALLGGSAWVGGDMFAWGAIVLLLIVISIRGIVNVGAIGIASLALGIYSLGSSGHGGILPEDLYLNLPFADQLWAIHRFLLPAVLLAVALAPAILIRSLRGYRAQLHSAALVLPLLIFVVSLAELNLRTPLFAGIVIPQTNSADARGAEALSTIIGEHQLIRLEPRVHCVDMKESTEFVARFSTIVAYNAAKAGAVTDSFNVSRGKPESCFAEEYRLAEPGTLVIQAAGRDDRRDLLFRPSFTEDYYCAATQASQVVPFLADYERGPIRLCSTNRQSIAAFAEAIGTTISSPAEPW